MRNETELRNALKELEARIDLHKECQYNTVIIAEVHALKFALGEVCSLQTHNGIWKQKKR